MYDPRQESKRHYSEREVGLLIVAQETIVGSRPVDILGLPGDLDAFPIYRIVTNDDGREVSRRILRLEVRGALARRTEGWRDALAAMNAKDRQWLLRTTSGRMKGIAERFGPQVLGFLYQWCASGIVTFQAEVPQAPGATHGALLNWRLADPVQDHALQAADEAETQRAEQAEEARHLAAELAQYPDARLLAAILAAPRDHSYLEHAIPVARAYLAGQPVPSGAQPLKVLPRGSSWPGLAEGWRRSMPRTLSQSARAARGQFAGPSTSPPASGSRSSASGSTMTTLGPACAARLTPDDTSGVTRTSCQYWTPTLNGAGSPCRRRTAAPQATHRSYEKQERFGTLSKRSAKGCADHT